MFFLWYQAQVTTTEPKPAMFRYSSAMKHPSSAVPPADSLHPASSAMSSPEDTVVPVFSSSCQLCGRATANRGPANRGDIVKGTVSSPLASAWAGSFHWAAITGLLLASCLVLKKIGCSIIFLSVISLSFLTNCDFGAHWNPEIFTLADSWISPTRATFPISLQRAAIAEITAC